MAKLTDLPDEVLSMICEYFKLSGQDSPYLRRFEEDDDEDMAKRAILAVLAQACKALYKAASPHLYQNRYISLDLTSKEASAAGKQLARLSRCRNVHHLLCEVRTDNMNSFLVSLANSATSVSVRSLSVTVFGEGTESIDLRPLKQLPNLVGFGLDLARNTTGVIAMPPLFRLPCLRELQISSADTFEQTANALSLATPTSLEILKLDYCVLEDPVDSVTLWRRSFGHKCLPRVHTLSITLHGNDEHIPTEVEEQVPSCFPSLLHFKLEYGVPDFDKFVSRIPRSATSLSVSLRKDFQLRTLFLLVKNDLQRHPSIRSINIDIKCGIRFWNKMNQSELIQLARDARVAAASQGVALELKDLAGILEDRGD